ncbi:hypothetical protein RAA17_24645 [Komagataeibacter rhaeticus]|nr:hypothetical protein [Komagataeibacter rhaeticus]
MLQVRAARIAARWENLMLDSSSAGQDRTGRGTAHFAATAARHWPTVVVELILFPDIAVLDM